VRTRIIVAIAALMAASALVAVPGPVGSRTANPDRAIDSASLTAVTIPLPAGSTATSISSTLDPAIRSAGWLGLDTTLAEPGRPAVQSSRPSVTVPAVRPGTKAKNFWRLDGDISWYGPGFYGHRTACGIAYTKTVIGVASRTVPCGTLVTFLNPDNGRIVTAPVIDRGPYVTGRQWDMSAGLCAQLDHCYTGTIQWRWGATAGG
jgi:rare lipoprotein A (peptidoglycan hydrolase)